MRVMHRNRWRQAWFYAPSGNLTEVIDGDGYRTGEWVETYNYSSTGTFNVAPPQGFANGAPFGWGATYDLILVANAGELDVDVGWRVWLAPKGPNVPEGASQPDNFEDSYMVESVSPSRHYVAVALKTARGE